MGVTRRSAVITGGHLAAAAVLLLCTGSGADAATVPAVDQPANGADVIDRLIRAGVCDWEPHDPEWRCTRPDGASLEVFDAAIGYFSIGCP